MRMWFDDFKLYSSIGISTAISLLPSRLVHRKFLPLHIFTEFDFNSSEMQTRDLNSAVDKMNAQSIIIPSKIFVLLLHFIDVVVIYAWSHLVCTSQYAAFFIWNGNLEPKSMLLERQRYVQRKVNGIGIFMWFFNIFFFISSGSFEKKLSVSLALLSNSFYSSLNTITLSFVFIWKKNHVKWKWKTTSEKHERSSMSRLMNHKHHLIVN